MLDLVSTWTAHTVSFADVGGEVRVETASFKTAAEILAGEEALAGGDPEGWVLIQEACEAWLPHEVRHELFEREGQDPSEIAEAILSLLSAGVEDEEEHEERQEEAQADARRMSWGRVYAEYKRFYGESREEVMSTPWPLFLVQHEAMKVIRARERLSWMRGYVAAKTGSADDLIEEADMPAPEKKAYHREPMNSERQQEIIQQFAEARSGRAEA